MCSENYAMWEWMQGHEHKLGEECSGNIFLFDIRTPYSAVRQGNGCFSDKPSVDYLYPNLEASLFLHKLAVLFYSNFPKSYGF